MRTRQEFVMDALFGMPVLRHEPGELKLLDEGRATERFELQRAENCYQLWLRGAKHASLEVRRFLDNLEPELPALIGICVIREAMIKADLCAKPPG